jgi:hypothetical protein
MKKSNTYIEDGFFIKVCSTEKHFENELLIYRLNLNMTPVLVSHNFKDTIVLEIIEGTHPDPSKISDIILAFDSLCDFHLALRNLDLDYAMNDVNPKNFLIDNDKRCYLFDFSEISEFGQDNDIIAFLLFFADMSSTELFVELLNHFLKEYKNRYNINLDLINQQIFFFDSRRQKYKKHYQASEFQALNREKFISSFN